jgi:hypothetical protein
MPLGLKGLVPQMSRADSDATATLATRGRHDRVTSPSTVHFHFKGASVTKKSTVTSAGIRPAMMRMSRREEPPLKVQCICAKGRAGAIRLDPPDGLGWRVCGAARRRDRSRLRRRECRMRSGSVVSASNAATASAQKAVARLRPGPNSVILGCESAALIADNRRSKIGRAGRAQKLSDWTLSDGVRRNRIPELRIYIASGLIQSYC